ncbi:PiggyBac transposable element-derived protein 4 [Amphibalanus amphitrite]|uniref:PiggyBac transposable element-derived protein 4 n=1 Tax=Amphibalanus amphitrite TaxID=1232801 RepID=A0A6A4VQC8_AMPAM|nr:PiggyBac transposable element-derived protein 4 [Amphibalanus amphitrite]
MVAEILRRTNEKLRQERELQATLYSPEAMAKVEHRVADLTESELWGFIGLCLLRGFYTVPVSDLFNPARGPAMFAATMGRLRFEAILRHLSFDDRQTRAARRTGDAFCHLRWFVDAFNAALRRHFRPSESVTLDESLVRFRGRCAFRVFMKSKPGRYGILLRTLADANHRYMLKVWPYSGGYPQEPERGPAHVHFGSVPDMVNYMVEELMGSGRNVTMDRFFTSTDVAENLLNSRLTIVGTMDRRRRMPEELKDPRGREEGTSLFAFHGEKTAVSFCPKKGKLVTALSTQHHEPLVDRGEWGTFVQKMDKSIYLFAG